MIILLTSRSVSLLLLALPAAALAASGLETYRVKCALCHDGGATRAPRVGQAADWTGRVGKGYEGLLRSALQGVPGTAMLPKAGFAELSENEVAEAVRYMVSTLGLQVGESASEPVKVEKQARKSAAPVDDISLALAVASALVNARVGGVQVEARQGRVTIKGVVDDAATIKRALAAASGVAGVRELENRLVSAELFEHD